MVSSFCEPDHPPTQPPSPPATHPDPPPPLGGVGTLGQIAQIQTNSLTHRPQTPPPKCGGTTLKQRSAPMAIKRYYRQTDLHTERQSASCRCISHITPCNILCKGSKEQISVCCGMLQPLVVPNTAITLLTDLRSFNFSAVTSPFATSPSPSRMTLGHKEPVATRFGICLMRGGTHPPTDHAPSTRNQKRISLREE